ncbi:MAG: DegV family protein [bacterium]
MKKNIDGVKLYNSFFYGKKEVFRKHKYLNKINVFPVADGDTGTNLALTMHSIIAGTQVEASVANVSRNMANAALMGSRGNSGIIFAQFVYGLSQEIRGKHVLSIKDFVSAVKGGVESAYKAVSKPVEGTILTVMKSWSDALHSIHKKTTDFVVLFNYSIKAAKKALQETPKRLHVLEQAGVVDAGAEGFVSFLEGFFYGLKQTAYLISETNENILLENTDSHTFERYKNLPYRYCTEGLLHETDMTADTLREQLSDFGDSLIIAETESMVKFHIHTNYPSQIFYTLHNQGVITQSKADDMKRQKEMQFQPKSSTAIVVDSACDIPPSLLDKYQIYMIPINVMFDKHHFLDKVTLNPDRFYSLLDEYSTFPTTSQPSIKVFEQLYSMLLDNYEHIISLHLSSSLSGTYNAAKLAAQKFPSEKISVVDTKHLSTSYGLIVQKVAESVIINDSFKKIVTLAESLPAKVTILVSVKNLKYMVRGGRVSALKGIVAKILNLKPIVSLDKEGNSKLHGKAFSFSANINKIIAMVASHNNKHSIAEYAIGHAHNKTEAKMLEEKLIRTLGKPAEYIIDISPVIGSHAGTGAVSVSYIEK